MKIKDAYIGQEVLVVNPENSEWTDLNNGIIRSDLLGEIITVTSVGEKYIGASGFNWYPLWLEPAERPSPIAREDIMELIDFKE